MVFAPAMIAIDTRYTEFWIGATFHHLSVPLVDDRKIQTYDQVANKNLKDLRLQTGAASKQLLENANQDMT